MYCSFAFIVMQIMLPETGIGGIVNEGSMAVLFSEGVGSSLLCSYQEKKKKITCACSRFMLSSFICVPGGWISGKVAARLIEE